MFGILEAEGGKHKLSELGRGVAPLLPSLFPVNQVEGFSDPACNLRCVVSAMSPLIGERGSVLLWSPFVAAAM
jgi:hypothetical protein